jgi:hypothetical protein
MLHVKIYHSHFMMLKKRFEFDLFHRKTYLLLIEFLFKTYFMSQIHVV